MPTLYEQNPKNWDAIAAKGFPSIAEMAKHMHRPVEMDLVLGYSGAASKWHNGTNTPAHYSEAAAKLWLAANKKPEAPRNNGQAPSATLTATFMVECPKAVAQKLEKICAMIGCEIIEL